MEYHVSKNKLFNKIVHSQKSMKYITKNVYEYQSSTNIIKNILQKPHLENTLNVIKNFH